MRSKNYSLLLLFLFYTQNVLGNRGSGKMVLETYNDATDPNSSDNPPTLPQDIQRIGVVAIPDESDKHEFAQLPKDTHPMIPSMDEQADPNTNDVKIPTMDDEQQSSVADNDDTEEKDNMIFPTDGSYRKEHNRYGRPPSSEEMEDSREFMEEEKATEYEDNRYQRPSSPSESEDGEVNQASMEAVSGTQDTIVENINDDSAKEENANEEFLPTKIQADANPGSEVLPPVPQVTGCRTQGQIAVTYSEGPSDATAGIVRQLNHADARANFFVNASWLYTQQYAMVVQNTYKAGHLIGMTYRVKNDDSSKLTDEELRKDIIEKAHIIETLIHVAPKYVRLHYTEPEDTRTENMLKSLGFILVGYNLDSQDYAHRDVDEVYRKAFRRYKDTYDAKGSFISVQYDMPGTVKLSTVPQMVNTISDEGYTMVRLDGCLNDPNPYKKSAQSTEYVSDKFSFNTTGYHQGQNAVPQSVIDEARESDNASGRGSGGDEETKNSGNKNVIFTCNLTAFVGILGFIAVIVY